MVELFITHLYLQRALADNQKLRIEKCRGINVRWLLYKRNRPYRNTDWIEVISEAVSNGRHRIKYEVGLWYS